jgi:hypothetical protein
MRSIWEELGICTNMTGVSRHGVEAREILSCGGKGAVLISFVTSDGHHKKQREGRMEYKT